MNPNDVRNIAGSGFVSWTDDTSKARVCQERAVFGKRHDDLMLSSDGRRQFSHCKGLLIAIASCHEDDFPVEIVLYARIQNNLCLRQQIVQQYSSPLARLKTRSGSIERPHRRVIRLSLELIEIERCWIRDRSAQAELRGRAAGTSKEMFPCNVRLHILRRGLGILSRFQRERLLSRGKMSHDRARAY